MRKDKIALPQVGRRALLLLLASLTCISFCGLLASAASAQRVKLWERTRILTTEHGANPIGREEEIQQPLLKEPKQEHRVDPPKIFSHQPDQSPFIEDELRGTRPPLLQNSFLAPPQVKISDFDKDGRLITGVDIGNAEVIYVKFGDSSSPYTKKAARIPSDRGPPRWGLELEPGFLLKASDKADPGQFRNELQNQHFWQDIRLVSYVNDTATDEAIRSARPLRDILLQNPPNSLEEICDYFNKHKGQPLIMIGHIEDGRFITRDPTGRFKLVDMPLEEIQKEAEKSGCLGLFLGCHSAFANVQNGVIEEFNPIDLIKLLNKAVQEPTIYDFYKVLSSDGFTIVVGQQEIPEHERKPKVSVLPFEIYWRPIQANPMASGFIIIPRLLTGPTPTPTPIFAAPVT